MQRILVAGLGKLGSVMAGLLANAGHEVVGVDPDRQARDALNAREPHVQEPGLAALLGDVPPEHLWCTDDWERAVASTDIAMLVVPTPSRPTGGFDPVFVLDAVTAIGERLRGGHQRSTPYTVVVCSTLMPGTMTTEIAPALEKASGLTVGESVLLAYSPEFIALGTVIADMSSPDQVLIGTQDRRSAEAAAALSSTFRTAPVRCMSFTDAEITKLAINAYLSVKIGFANMIGHLVDTLGGDPGTVLNGVGADRRIGTAYLKKGGPPTGPCLPRDLVALETLGTQTGVPVPLATAARQAARDVIDQVLAAADLRHGPVGILGVAYKPGSPVTDDSMARSLITRAALAGQHPAVYDPHATLPKSFPYGYWRCASVSQFLAHCNTVIIACPHPEFDDIDFGRHTVINPWR